MKRPEQAAGGPQGLLALHRQEQRLWRGLAVYSLLNTSILLLLLSVLIARPLPDALPQVAVYLLLGLLIVLGATAHLHFLGRRKGLDSQWRRRAADHLEGEEGAEGIRDPLTGLYTRRFFDEFVSAEMRRCERWGAELSLMLVDLVGFREMNQRLGHLAGDQILQATAEVLTGSVRASDTVFRFGGDEFALVLTGTPRSAADLLRPRLLRRVAEDPGLRRLAGGPLRLAAVTASCARGTELDAVVDGALLHLHSLSAPATSSVN